MLRFGQPLLPPVRAAHGLVRALLGVLGGAVFLSGCGFVRHEPREPWRAQAELACMKSGIIQESQWIRPSKPIDGPGPCGTDLPLKVSGFRIDPATLASYASMSAMPLPYNPAAVSLTVLKPEVTMGCPLVAWTDDWVAGSVQPAAMAWFGQPVKEIRTAGAYTCRRRNHNPNARLSEHAFGNAIDVMSFVFADGYVATVKGGWRGTQQEQGFLRDVLHGACERFKTVLGPGSDALHYDHFHLDLARHDAKGQRRYCKPKLDPPARPLAGTFAQTSPRVQGPYAGQLTQLPPAPMAKPSPQTTYQTEQLPLEIEDEFDPKAFDVTSSVGDLPRPRTVPAPRQPLPARSGGMLPIRQSAPDFSNRKN